MGLSLTLPSPAKRAPLSSSGKMRAPGQLELRARCAHGSDGEATQQPWPDESPVRSSGWMTPNSEGFIRSESFAATAAALQPSYDHLSLRTSPVCSFNSSHSRDVSSTQRVMRSNLRGRARRPDRSEKQPVISGHSERMSQLCVRYRLRSDHECFRNQCSIPRVGPTSSQSVEF
jgi:hypothetical protein